MKIIESQIKNYRLLHNTKITFDKETTSIVGKNNSGKTSLSTIFETFLAEKSPKFAFDDFSLNSHEEFLKVYEMYQQIKGENREETLEKIIKKIPKIQLFIKLQYDEKDNWRNITPFLTSLEESNELTILCEYAPEDTEKLLIEIHETIKTAKETTDNILKNYEVLYEKHYKCNYRPYSEKEETDNLNRSDVQRLIQARFIDAQRVLDDSNADSRSKLSKVFQDQFEFENEQDMSKSVDLLNSIQDASDNIDSELFKFFATFVNHFNTFGFPGLGNEKVELKAELKPELLFKNNIKLFYNHGGKKLPEKYNGLGYSNLIYIISQIIGFYNTIKEKGNDLNLIFIEEPEAHMHPQMQSVFINNIEKFLAKVGLKAQVIITTHSSHVLADSKLESIRYFTKDVKKKTAIIKDLMSFSSKLTERSTREFLQQYLTLGNCDLFFADKAILFEGTVERILLPMFIAKNDTQKKSKLIEQYIASIEVGGAYISKFKELLDFLDLKTLIITDLDSVSEVKTKNKNDEDVTNYQKIEVTEAKNLKTSNVTLSQWIPGEQEIASLLNVKETKKIKGKIRVAYQTLKEGTIFKCGRSFEEAFVIQNNKYIYDNKNDLISIKNKLKSFNTAAEVLEHSYEIQEYIDSQTKKKTEFAFDLLNVNLDDWQTPSYIQEGLSWLAK